MIHDFYILEYINIYIKKNLARLERILYCVVFKEIWVIRTCLLFKDVDFSLLVKSFGMF